MQAWNEEGCLMPSGGLSLVTVPHSPMLQRSPQNSSWPWTYYFLHYYCVVPSLWSHKLIKEELREGGTKNVPLSTQVKYYHV